jgi:hypothetical protein
MLHGEKRRACAVDGRVGERAGCLFAKGKVQSARQTLKHDANKRVLGGTQGEKSFSDFVSECANLQKNYLIFFVLTVSKIPDLI